jgi:D-3-phosphoglycerate dehydrogenase / 2-oxoglutarate reductase
MKIAVLDDYSNAFRSMPSFERLKGHEVAVYHDTVKDTARLAERLHDVDAVVLTQERSSFRRPLIEKLPKLKLVAQTGSHRGHFDIDACTEHGIAIASLSGGGMSYSTAELTWGLILAALRHIPFESEQLKRGAWQSTIGTSLRGKTLGIYALGKIGTTVAEVGRTFGMKVMCWGREASQAKAREAGYEVPESREAFFAQADVLSLHIYFNAETRGIVKAPDLACMKPTALLVNTSRAGLIEAGALVNALKQGRPGYAAVDVYEDEPVTDATHPLLSLPNVLCTPHLGYAADSQFRRFYEVAVDHILAFASGQPSNIINPKALTHPRHTKM